MSIGRSPLEALNELIAIASGERSDPDRPPQDAPAGTCDWGACDARATAWRWYEDLGGWIRICAAHTEEATSYVCDACKGTFLTLPDWNPEPEAAAAYTPAELEDRAVVCEVCWRAMRAAMPDMDARYPPLDGETGACS